MRSSKGIPTWGVKRFLNAVFKVRNEYPVLWANSGKKNRIIMVRYWLDGSYWCGITPPQVEPGNQISLWSA